MTYAEFVLYIRKQTGTNSNTFTIDELLLYANIWKDQMAKRIVRTKDDFFGVPMFADLLVNNDGSPQREYPLDDSVFQQVKYVEAMLDGARWVPLTELDLTEYRGTTDEATITRLFNNEPEMAQYDLFRGSLWIYSGTFAAVKNGIKLWTFQWPVKLIASMMDKDVEMHIDPTNTQSGFPTEFQELLARRVIIAKKTQTDKPIQITQLEQAWETDMLRELNDLVDTKPIMAQLPEENQYDNGFNL